MESLEEGKKLERENWNYLLQELTNQANGSTPPSDKYSRGLHSTVLFFHNLVLEALIPNAPLHKHFLHKNFLHK
jgi:hypothetical protein